MVNIWTDGSGMATGGPGGWAAVLVCGGRRKEISGGEREATNNSMEMMAAIRALQTLKQPSQVTITTDSEYLKFGAEDYLSGWKRFGWKTREGDPVKNRELWEELDAQLQRHRVAWVHEPGHRGEPNNERCDELAGIERRKMADQINGIDCGALFSEDRVYRWLLWRAWGKDPAARRLVNFVMLNPSTADEVVNDPTVERCERRARSWGFDGLLVTNIFAYRATDPDVMKQAKDPVGGSNDSAILAAAKESELTVCAWGVHGDLNGRAAAVEKLLREAGVKLHVLKLTKDGKPAHPLYLPYRLEPREWTVGAAPEPPVDVEPGEKCIHKMAPDHCPVCHKEIAA